MSSPDRYERHGGRDGDRDQERDRERERGERDRYRERDREPRERYRRRSRSRSRSRSDSPPRRRERGRRATGFDLGPDPNAPSRPSGFRDGPDHGRGPPPGGHGHGGRYNNNFNPQQFAQGLAGESQATRHARRVYVGNLPPGVNQDIISAFFSQALQAVGGTKQTGSPVLNVYINHEKRFSFVEFRTVEETSNAMALDGILFEGSNVRVRRPNDYNPAFAATLGPSTPSPDLKLDVVGLHPGGYVSACDAPDRIFIGGLPYYLAEPQIRELLGQFGAIRGFDLVKDKETGNSKGYGFVLYEDTSVTDVACSGLNGLRMGDKTLTVRRANQGRRQPGQQQQQQQQQHNFFPQANNNAILQQQTIAALASQANPTTVVRLSNCVTEAELMKDDEYKEIVEDMRDEGGRHGEVLEVLIPRPSPPPPPPQPAAEDGDNPTPPPPAAASAQGVGKVYVKYAEVSSAMKAFQAMNGRKFSGNIVVAEFMSEENFAKGLLDD